MLKADIAELKADMTADLATVKTDVAALKTDVAVLKERSATKEDLQQLAKALSGQFMTWFFGLAGLVLSAAGLVLGGVCYMLTNVKH